MSDWIGEIIKLGGQVGFALANKRKKINPYLQAVRYAKQAGIHPLVALGGGFSPSMFAQPPSPWGDVLLGAGEGIGNAVSGYLSEKEQQVEDARERMYRGSRDSAYDKQQAIINEQQERRLRIDEEYLKLAQAQSRTAAAELAAQAKGATTGDKFLSMFPLRKFGMTAQDAENMGGELGSEAQGLGNILASEYMNRPGGGDPWQKFGLEFGLWLRDMLKGDGGTGPDNPMVP